MTVVTAGLRNPSRSTLAWLVLGGVAWAALAVLGVRMYTSNDPPSAGFDLELLLLGGRRVAEGFSPYEPGMLRGESVEIQSLFYSYPPPVAQLTSVIAAVPSWIVMIVWIVAAAIAAVAVAALLERRITGRAAATLALPVAALLPLWFPYAIAILFGNLDAWFAALFGILLLVVIAGDRRAIERRDVVAAGIALAIVALTKVHPASLGLWFVVRGLRTRSAGTGGTGITLPPEWRIVGVAATTGLLIFGASLVVGGLGPWQDYVAVLRAGTNADLLDGRNLGPAVQIALLANLGPEAVRILQVGVTAVAVVATAAVAWRLRDPVESLAWASVASFVVLPVSWYHYPAALVPFAVAAVARARLAGGDVERKTQALVVAALVIGLIGIGLPIMWLAVLVLLLAVRASGATNGRVEAPTSGHPVPA